MKNGYIKVSRNCIDDPLYFSEPFTKWQAWCDLVMLAYISDSELYIRGIKIKTQRGCVYVGTRELADRWKWSRGKVIRFMEFLEQDEKIVPQTIPQIKNVISCISICNFDSYQCCSTSDDTTNSTTKEKKKKEAKKKKNKEEEYNPPFIPPKGYEEYDFSFVDEKFRDTFIMWLEYKRGRRQKYKTQDSLVICYKKLIKDSKSNPDTALKIIENSMAHNYSGFFPIKDDHTGQLPKPKDENEKSYNEWMESNFPRVAKMEQPLTIDQFNGLRKYHGDDTLIDKLRYMQNWRGLDNKISASETIKELLKPKS